MIEPAIQPEFTGPCLNIIRAFGRIRSLGESRPNPFFGRRRRRHPLLPTFLGRLRILIETNIVSRSWDIGIANNVQGLLLRHQARESSVRDTHGEVRRRRRRRRRRLRVILHGEFRLDDSHSPDGIQQEKGRGGSGPTAASERDARGRGRPFFCVLLFNSCDGLAIKVPLQWGPPSPVPATKHESPVDLKPPRGNPPVGPGTINRVRWLGRTAALIPAVRHRLFTAPTPACVSRVTREGRHGPADRSQSPSR
ncbi:hypothetical protein BHM03_00010903 [Ensete ventricosum]|nr:hypothetical protein BHM03_00010903 [Ensete ventricosum]